MIRMEPNVVMKYCELLDRFVKLRMFNEEDTRQLLHGVKLTNRDAYRSLVVNACVVNYCDQVVPQNKRENQNEGHLEEQLYVLAVDLNPQLDIKKVTLPVGDGKEEGMDLTLIEGEEEQARPRPADIRNLEKILARRIIGQDEAVGAVASAVKRAWVGIADPHRPVGTFLFAGQTGVGKTELSKALAQALYGDEDRLVRIDCSEYSLPHEYAKLIGAPPGYVGHESSGYLTEEMTRVGSGVILFDEIEKAHEKVHNLLLQVMDEGLVTDNKGNRVSFAESVVILTSNIGVREVDQVVQRVGFGQDPGRVPTHEERIRATRESLREMFRPEFVNRLDEVIIFRTLDETSCLKISELLLRDLRDRARRTGLSLSFTPGVRRMMVRRGFNPSFGARELRRTVKRLIEEPLAQKILDAEVPKKGPVRVRVKGGGVDFEIPQARDG